MAVEQEIAHALVRIADAVEKIAQVDLSRQFRSDPPEIGKMHKDRPREGRYAGSKFDTDHQIHLPSTADPEAPCDPQENPDLRPAR